MGAAALPAKVGSRLAHVAVPMVLPSPAMVASALGAHIVGPAGMGGAGAAAVGAGIGKAAGMTMISLMDMIPVLTTGVIATGSPDVMLGPGQIAVMAPSLPQPCAPHLAQPIPMGSPTVMIHGMQLVRVGDKTTCGAFVCDGVKGVMVGGPGAPSAPMSMNDVLGGLGAAALGALLDKTGAVQAANEFGTAIAEKVDQAMGKVDQALGKANEAVDKGIGKANQAIDKVFGKVDQVSDKVFGKADQVLGKANRAVDQVFGKVDQVLGKVDEVTKKAETLMDKGIGAVDKTLNTATNVVDKVTNTAGAVVDKTMNAATNVMDKATNATGAALGKFGEMIGSVGSAMEAILGGAGLAGPKK